MNINDIDLTAKIDDIAHAVRRSTPNTQSAIDLAAEIYDMLQSEKQATVNTAPPALPKKTADNVNHPTHYTYGKIEVIDYIIDKNFDFCLGNVIKYISRAGRKGDELEDLKKAMFYLQRKIDMLEMEVQRESTNTNCT